MNTIKPIWQALMIGAIAGMRAAYAPALISHILNTKKSKRLTYSPIRFVESDAFANTTKVFALGELIGDKLPATPARIEPTGVVARCVSGSFSGVAFAKAKGDNVAVAALLSTTAALASTFLCYYLRKKLVKEIGVADPWIGALEDSIVIGSGIALIQSA
ncbi:MAG: hypothetical protein ACHQHN_17615 [Sphingobacteriales bacterium]